MSEFFNFPIETSIYFIKRNNEFVIVSNEFMIVSMSSWITSIEMNFFTRIFIKEQLKRGCNRLQDLTHIPIVCDR